MIRASWAMILVACAAAGCFAPRYGDGQLHCAAEPHRCPDGYHCAVDDACWSDGHDPTPLHSGVTSFTAGGGVTIMDTGTHRATLAIGVPLATTAAAPGGHAASFGLLPLSATK